MSEPDGPDPVTQRACRLFERSVERLDGSTRSRLTRSRQAALAVAAPRRGPSWLRGFAPAGAIAAAAVLGVALWLGLGPAPVTPEAGSATMPGAIEFVAQADDVEMLDDDLEFYAWAVDSAAGEIG
jgi:hypothetical protein